MSDLALLDNAVANLLAGIDPRERKRLAERIARDLRASQSARIAARHNPDGTPYVPRKQTLRHQRGAIRRAMFQKIRTARWLKIEASPESAVVAFAGQVQRIAQVHQLGLRDRVNRRGGPEVDYPKRELLGITEAEIAAVERRVLDHLAAR